MEPLAALGEILLKAVPTFLLVWILYAYTVRMLYRPLQDALQKRFEATGKLRQDAEANLATVEQKANEYREALRSAWTEVYRQQEQQRQQSLEQRAEMLRQARQQADERVSQARRQIREEAQEAKKGLAAESEQIALSIAEAILKAPGAPPFVGSETTD